MANGYGEWTITHSISHQPSTISHGQRLPV
jgi:hypothetical protein